MKNKCERAYTSFSMVYDELMDDIPYDEWADYLVELLREEGIQKGKTLAELGCGTGKMTRRLAEAGYQMLGVDLSEDMLMVARDVQMEHFYSLGVDIDFSCESVTDDDHILYIQQDMAELELDSVADAFVSICDSMNYLTEEDALYKTFCNVAKYMASDGVFIFDMKTPYFFREVLADNTFAESRDEVSFIWENYFDMATQINEYALSLFVPLDDEESVYRKFEEYHYQRAYSVAAVKEQAQRAGLRVTAVYDALTKEVAKDNSERWYFVLKHKD